MFTVSTACWNESQQFLLTTQPPSAQACRDKFWSLDRLDVVTRGGAFLPQQVPMHCLAQQRL